MSADGRICDVMPDIVARRQRRPGLGVARKDTLRAGGSGTAANEYVGRAGIGLVNPKPGLGWNLRTALV